ncbi:hypothetical protein EDD16DRAFT_1256660 [Pisolithus croceorrhizus]|nr:hypothetical protein EDD16DRAFT_1256660 [Pisolithus croceorrhizus]
MNTARRMWACVQCLLFVHTRLRTSLSHPPPFHIFNVCGRSSGRLHSDFHSSVHTHSENHRVVPFCFQLMILRLQRRATSPPVSELLNCLGSPPKTYLLRADSACPRLSPQKYTHC